MRAPTSTRSPSPYIWSVHTALKGGSDGRAANGHERLHLGVVAVARPLWFAFEVLTTAAQLPNQCLPPVTQPLSAREYISAVSTASIPSVSYRKNF